MIDTPQAIGEVVGHFRVVMTFPSAHKVWGLHPTNGHAASCFDTQCSRTLALRLEAARDSHHRAAGILSGADLVKHSHHVPDVDIV